MGFSGQLLTKIEWAGFKFVQPCNFNRIQYLIQFITFPSFWRRGVIRQTGGWRGGWFLFLNRFIIITTSPGLPVSLRLFPCLKMEIVTALNVKVRMVVPKPSLFMLYVFSCTIKLCSFFACPKNEPKKGTQKSNLRTLFSHMPARTMAQSPSVRTFLGFACTPLIKKLSVHLFMFISLVTFIEFNI